MKFLSLFSGIEAASAAWVPLGWSPVAFAEVEPFPCSVLRAHYPHVPNLGDVTKIARQQIEELGGIDLVCGGFPCQDLSVAGKRKGLMNADGSATRSGLFFDAMRIAEWARARWTVLENVPGLFSSNDGRDFAAVVGEMAGCEFDVPTGGWENAGVAVGPLGLVEWATLDAQYVRVESHPRAVPQRRRRVFLVRDSGNWANRPPLFLEPEGMRGDPAPRRQARESVAGTLSARTKGGGGLGTDSDLAGGLVSHTLLGKPNCSHAADKETYVTHSLRGEGFDASEDGTGRGTPLVPVQVCPTLRAGGNRTGGDRPPGTDVDTADSLIPVAFDTTQWAVRRLTPLIPAIVSQAMSSKWAKGTAGPAGDEHHNLIPVHIMSGTQHASTENVSPALGALNPMAVSYQQGASHADATKAGACETLYALRIAVGQKAFQQWAVGGHGGIPAPEVLRQDLHGGSVRREAGKARSELDDSASPRTESMSAWAMRSLWEAGPDGCSPQGRKLAQQLAGQPDSALSLLSHQGSPRWSVRRLTPLEAERLMGFPDGSTDVLHKSKHAADGLRYRALGNSWAVNVATWVGTRIQQVDKCLLEQSSADKPRTNRKNPRPDDLARKL